MRQWGPGKSSPNKAPVEEVPRPAPCALKHRSPTVELRMRRRRQTDFGLLLVSPCDVTTSIGAVSDERSVSGPLLLPWTTRQPSDFPLEHGMLGAFGQPPGCCRGLVLSRL